MKDLAAEIDLTHEAFYRAFVGFGSKAEELTASTTSLLHPWELTIQQTLRLGGSGPKAAVHCSVSGLFSRKWLSMKK